MNNKILRMIPFFILCTISLYALYECVVYGNEMEIRHYLGLGFLAVNLVVYFNNFETGIVLTGLILLLSTFNILTFFYHVEGASIFVFAGPEEDRIKISTPEISIGMSFVLLLYIIINGKAAVSSIKEVRSKYLKSRIT